MLVEKWRATKKKGGSGTRLAIFKGMEIAWNESLTLQLISAVQKVEDDWGIREWEDQEEMWRQIADELPLSFPGLLGVDLEEFSDLCKTRFLMICRCFNEVFIKHTRHNCLTYKVMSALAGYSLRSDGNAYFREIGPQEHFRAIVSVSVERSDIGYCTSSGTGPGGLAASDEYSPNMVKHEVEEVRTVEEPRKDELLDEDSKERQEKRNTLNELIKDELLDEDSNESQEKRSTLGKLSKNELLDEDSRESQKKRSVLGKLIKDELLDEVSDESLDFLATTKSEEENNSSMFSGFVVKIQEWNVRKGLVAIPRAFCLKYMPRCHATLLTCIRNGKKYQIKYLPHRFALSGGWPNFSRANDVKENDKLVFRRLDLSTYQVVSVGRECSKKTLRAPRRRYTVKVTWSDMNKR